MNSLITSVFKAIEDTWNPKRIKYNNTLQKGKTPISAHDGWVETDENTLKEHGINIEDAINKGNICQYNKLSEKNIVNLIEAYPELKLYNAKKYDSSNLIESYLILNKIKYEIQENNSFFITFKDNKEYVEFLKFTGNK